MIKVLITYYSESGSTKEIAELIASQLTYVKTEVLEITQINNLNYDKIIIGTPNMFGKPAPKIIKFLKLKNKELSNIPVIIYFTCMDFYDIPEKQNIAYKIYKDSHFQDNIKEVMESSWEKSHSILSYADNLNKIAPELNIISMAFFKGRLILKNLSLIKSLVMRFICLINKNINEGNYFKHQDVKSWINNLEPLIKSD